MTTFNGKLSVLSDFTYAGTPDLGETAHRIDDTTAYKFTDGEAADQAEVMFADQRTLAASTGEELDLSGSALQDQLGNDLAFTSIKIMVVKAADANTNDLLVGGAAANGFNSWASDPTDEVVVVPGGTFILVAPDAAGYLVTDATADLLRIENSAGGSTVTYDITLIGTV